MDDERTRLVQIVTAAVRNLTIEELRELATTAERKASWNEAMRSGEVQAGLLRRQRAGRLTEARYEELAAFCREIGAPPKLGAELWNILAFALANISRANANLARTTPLKVEAIRQCANGQARLDLRPPLQQLLIVWIASY